MRTNKAYLKRAWKHLLRDGLAAHKGRAAQVFCLGLITTLIQMLAVLLLIGAARAYDNGGILDYANISLDLNKGSGTSRVIYISLTASFLVLSIIAGVVNKLIITNIGRHFFEELLTEMRQRILDNVINGRSFDRTDTLKILNRDCRFLSLSYLRVLTLLQPALFLIGIFIVAILFVPIAAVFLGIAGLIVLPLNIYLVLWAARTSQDLQDSAKLKSAEEKDFIASVSTHPFIHRLPQEDFVPENRPGETGFLNAFVKRQRMGAYSQSITDLMMALVIVALALFLFFGGGNRLLLNLSNLVILVILFRFMTGYISQVAQAVTMISSYEPFFRSLLDLNDKALSQDAETAAKTGLNQPLRLAVFQNNETDWSDVDRLKQTFNISQNLQYVTSNYEISSSQMKEWLTRDDTLSSALPQNYRTECNQFAMGEIKDLSLPAKLLLAISYYSARPGHALLLNGKDLVSIDREIMRFIMAAPGNMPFIIVYKNAPRSLILPPRFQLVVNTNGRVELIGQLADFTKLRDEIMAKLNAPVSTLNAADNIFGFESD